MAGTISIALKAVDQYSGVITGLNQGFELVGKALSAIKGAADLAFNAINEGVQLAAKGGTYAEMRRQFNNVAASFNADGQSILNDLNKITANMISLPDAARLAGKGISAGLSSEQIASAFTFIKRRTELTGEDFNAMSEQVFSALQSGRYSVLKQMGLVIEKGAKIGDVMSAITVATRQYGDAGFNVADNLSALNNQQDKFVTALGVAINETPLFQKAMTLITDAVIQLVEMFDPRPLTVFFDVFGQLFVSIIKSAASIVPGLDSAFSFIGELLSGTAKQTGDVVIAISKSLFSIIRTVAQVGNTIVEILDQLGLVTFVEFTISAIIDIVRYGVRLVTELTSLMVGGLIQGLSESARVIRETAIAFPTLAGTLGTDLVGLADFEVAMNKAGWLLDGLTKKAADTTNQTADFFQNLNAGAALAARQGVDIGFLNDLEKDLNDRIGGIDWEKTWGEALSPEKIKMPIVDGFNAASLPAAAAAKDIGKAASSAFSESFGKDLYNNWDKIKLPMMENPLFNAEGLMKLDPWRLMKMEKYVEEQEQRSRERMQFEFDLRQAELDANAERMQRMNPAVQLQGLFQQANWPAEMDAFMRVIFAWLINIAGGESVPLAITTGI